MWNLKVTAVNLPTYKNILTIKMERKKNDNWNTNQPNAPRTTKHMIILFYFTEEGIDREMSNRENFSSTNDIPK